MQKIFEQINEKSRAGINGYFCIKKILHFNGNEYWEGFKSVKLQQQQNPCSIVKFRNHIYQNPEFYSQKQIEKKKNFH